MKIGLQRWNETFYWPKLSVVCLNFQNESYKNYQLIIHFQLKNA